MRHRYILLVALLISALSAWADMDKPRTWQAPYEGNYTTSYIVHGLVVCHPLNGPDVYAEAGDKIAAFIDGSCRAVYEFTGQPTAAANGALPYELSTLRIRVNQEDQGKAIEYRYSAGGKVYRVVGKNEDGQAVGTHYRGGEYTEGTASHPIEFAISPRLTKITLQLKKPHPEGITMRVGEQLDLSATFDIQVQPEGAQIPENAHWEPSNFYSVQEDVLTATHETIGGSMALRYVYGKNEVAEYRPFTILPAEVSVEGIELLQDEEVDTYRGESFRISYKITPAEASNQAVRIVCNDPLAFELGSPEQVGTGYVFSAKALKKGYYEIRIVTEEGNYEADVMVHTRVRLISARFKEATATYMIGEKYGVPELVLDPVDADYDEKYSELKVVATDKTLPLVERWQLADEDWQEFTPLLMCKNVTIEYKIPELQEPIRQLASFAKRYEYDKGWNWVSVPYEYDFRAANPDPSEGLMEVRSYDKVAFNDMKYGWFGDEFNMQRGQAYKQMGVMPTANVVHYSRTPNVEPLALHVGWNWIATPYEYDYPTTMYANGIRAAEGDIILSHRRGMMTFVNGHWESTTGELFALESGRGYLYYSNGSQATINWGEQFKGDQPLFAAVPAVPSLQRGTNKVWHYDVGRFATAMAVVGQMAVGADEEVSRYSVGAFVGDECRGEGVVLKNGMLLVSLSGEEGEEVRFELCDKKTGEVWPFATSLDYELLSGTVQHPVRFELEKHRVTGIDEVSRDGVRVAIVGGKLRVEGGYPYRVYSADGKEVKSDALLEGVYVVVVETPQGIVRRKVSQR